MIEGTLEKSANLITMTYSGRVDPEQTRGYVPRVQAMLAEAQPGFRLLTDLRRLEAMDLGCVPHIEQVMDLCDDRGISMVVRIIPEPHKDIGLNILSLFHYRRGVRIVTCKTIEEAQAALGGRPRASEPGAQP